MRHELTDRFGGITAFVRSPAVGLWKDDEEDVTRDDVVMFEVMAEHLDDGWEKRYRQKLEHSFRQENNRGASHGGNQALTITPRRKKYLRVHQTMRSHTGQDRVYCSLVIRIGAGGVGN